MAKSGSTIRLRGEAAADFARAFGISLGKDRSWPDDEEQYQCKCLRCEQTFFGYKRRVICRECDGKRELAEQEAQ